MAITDNVFTGDELRAAVKANPAVLETVKGFLTQEQKFVVQTADEHKTFLEKYEGEKIAPRVAELAKTMEKDIEAVTGIKKESDNEKYYDYAKRVLNTLKSKAEGLETQINDLKSKTNLTDAEKQRLAQLETALTQKETEISTLKETKNKEVNELKVTTQLEAALAGLRGKYKKGIPETLVRLAEENAKQALIASAEFQNDGTLTFKKDGQVLTDPANAYKPKTAAQLLSDQLKEIIDEGKKQEGAGSSGSKDTKPIVDGKFVWGGIPPEVKTKVQLGDYLKRNAVLDGSEAWDKVFNEEEVKALPLR